VVEVSEDNRSEVAEVDSNERDNPRDKVNNRVSSLITVEVEGDEVVVLGGETTTSRNEIVILRSTSAPTGS
jgi:hypothetical protein